MPCKDEKRKGKYNQRRTTVEKDINREQKWDFDLEKKMGRVLKTPFPAAHQLQTLERTSEHTFHVNLLPLFSFHLKSFEIHTPSACFQCFLLVALSAQSVSPFTL